MVLASRESVLQLKSAGVVKRGTKDKEDRMMSRVQSQKWKMRIAVLGIGWVLERKREWSVEVTVNLERHREGLEVLGAVLVIGGCSHTRRGGLQDCTLESSRVKS